MNGAKRYSKKREAILDTICTADCHPSVEWVYSQLKPSYPDLSLGTVYRNVSQFKDEGTVICVGVVGGQERYDGDIKPHLHFVCQGCESVFDIQAEQDNTGIDIHVAQKYGIKVDYHNTVFYGTCKDCLSRQRADGND